MIRLILIFPAYKCKYCERAFAQSNDLVKHLRSHVGTNTYQCDQCSIAFRLQSELREHAKSHYIKGESSAEPQGTDMSGHEVIMFTVEEM